MASRWLLLLSLTCLPANAMDIEWKGVADMRISHSSGIQSYVSGQTGKLQNSPGGDLSLGQLGVALNLGINDQSSIAVVGNSFIDDEKNSTGLTELFYQRSGLPNENGLRHGMRLGMFYPPISLENRATAWSPANSLTPSTMNSWIGEEIRTTGFEYTAEWLGKFRQADYDLKLSTGLFTMNDTAGAMLSWHGWGLSSRQSVYGEGLPIPQTPAQTGILSVQAKESDPFHEGDDRLGYYLNAEYLLKRKLLLQAGYYDNNATPYVETDGQYGWNTQFTYAGFRWRLNKQWSLMGQLMQGSTLMQSPQRVNVVDNDYRSGYLTLSWHNKPHSINARLEEFSVTDLDQTPGDNNDEYGKAFTLSYRYRLDKQWFLLSELNWIDSNRAARAYSNENTRKIEQQLQMALRYYF
ncbi:hypothetical protein [Neptuniibacter caesariensis]|uniref:Porin n=1 Tax=Neptuniibacter caesariensis TaxID=207954 RepID=A0A7U8C6U9_NEPCE|nr:hypothetical protein [Neptuniibacter caesariensis]EAR61175.1 hypothetical protein MED92_04954 [Oceanospirillum sp. MED92] [Neptuniibacter caesariensis]